MNMNILQTKQARFKYFPLRKTFEKQTKTIDGEGRKQVEVWQFLDPRQQLKPIKDLFLKIF